MTGENLPRKHPIAVFRYPGTSIRIPVWENIRMHANGKVARYCTFQVIRTYSEKTASDSARQWKNTSTFGLHHLHALRELLAQLERFCMQMEMNSGQLEADFHAANRHTKEEPA